jgi:hypothetical protein
MRKTYSLPLAVLLAVAGTAASQSAGGEESPPPAMTEPLPLATYPSALQPSPVGSGAMVDLQAPPPDNPFCNRFWVVGEYLMWFTKGNQLPPLLTAGSISDNLPGALGQPGTSILYGGGNVSTGLSSGGRLRGGLWFGDDRVFGVDATFFFLAPTTNNSSFNSPSNQVLALPYFDTLTTPAQANATILSYPGQSSATFTAAVKNSLWGADTDFRLAFWRSYQVQASFLAGFRYLQLNDSLDLTTNATTSAGGQSGGPTGSIVSNSSFDTRNDFYGAQLGGDLSWCWGRFFLDSYLKVAVGATHESATIGGNTQVTAAGTVLTSYPLGPLAASTNIGTNSRNVFAVVPEFGLTLGWQFNPHIRALVGGTALYLSRAMRPGDIIDTGVNPTVLGKALLGTPVSGTPHPTFPNTDSDFWAGGANFGLEFCY